LDISVFESEDHNIIINKLRSSQLRVMFLDSTVNVQENNFEPEFTISSFQNKIKSSDKSNVDLIFKSNEIIQDKNFLFSDNISIRNFFFTKDRNVINNDCKYSPSIDKIFNMIDDLKKNNITDEKRDYIPDPIFAEFKINNDLFFNRYLIRYKKISVVIAQAGGVLNAIVVLIELIGYFVIEFQFYAKVVQQTLDIDFNSTVCMLKDIQDEKKVSGLKGQEELKKMFSEINFISHVNKKKNSFKRNNLKSNETGRKMLNDNSNINSFNNKEDHSPVSYRKEFNKNHNQTNNQPINSLIKNQRNNLNQSHIEEMEKENKMNSYFIAVEKARISNSENRNKKNVKVSDDVFFLSNVFNFGDFVYKIYKFFFKIKPFGNLENRNLLFEKSKNNFYRTFEVNNIIKKNIEIDLIKYLLMSTDQLNLYRLVQKPLITLKKTNLTDFNKAYDDFSEDRLYTKDELKNMLPSQKEDIKKSFLNIYEKKQSNVLNRKLLRMVEDRISLFLEE
jgi:hypothetical protein